VTRLCPEGDTDECFLRGTYGAEALLLLPPHLASDEVLYDLGILCGRAHQLGRVALGCAG